MISGHIPTTLHQGLIVPIPKGRNVNLSHPSNFRGITLLSVIGKVLEKVLLSRLSTQTALIHPLQGGFKPRMGCMHTAFVLQHVIRLLRAQKKKVYVAFLDVRKAFDTVWHNGLLLKLLQFLFPKYIWTLLFNWYRHSNSAVLWNSRISRSFQIEQGVHEGAVLSPLLYCIYVNELLCQLSSSGYGVYVHNIFCGSPMYADDLALVGHSISDLQNMLNIVSNFPFDWWYKLNASKSAVVVIGEAQAARIRNSKQRQWHISGEQILEKDSYHHLGILRSSTSSSFAHTAECCSAGRSAFFCCNAVGSRFGCLHPATTLRLYKTFCLPILIYGCELWSITKTELLMLECVHRKILRTIVGLPTCCKTKALLHTLGSLSIERLIQLRQINFLHSFSFLPSDSLHCRVLVTLIKNPPAGGILPRLHNMLQEYGLPSMEDIFAGHWSKEGWKRLTKRALLAVSFSEFMDDCDNLPLAQCSTLKL